MTLSMQSERVRIRADKVDMEGALWLPEDHIGVVLFAQSGSANRVKPPNDHVASVLRDARLGTLWLDLMTPHETSSYAARFDLALLTERLDAACDWLRQYDATKDLPIGLFGADIGAAAVLQLAGERGRGISAIVLRGGRTALAGQSLLTKITAPTLLIAGGLDDGVIEMNRAVYANLRCKKRIEIIPGATHSFEEPGNHEVVARFTRAWFLQHAYSAYV
jgi:putative phosphoribosyl transferase